MKPITASILLASLATGTAQAANPVVLELYTSQSCSSCPPADALLQQLAADPNLIALSFHIDYWNQLGWEDPFALAESTQRQNDYAQSLRQTSVYTPELVIDGAKGVVGSDRAKVQAAIEAASAKPKPVHVTLTPGGAHAGVTVSIAPNPAGPGGDVWLVTYDPKAVTAIRGGENEGKNLTSINNVTGLRRLGTFDRTVGQTFDVPTASGASDGYAVLVQEGTGGPVVGAADLPPAGR